MTGGSGDDDWFSLAELTTRLGGLVWIEGALNDIVGTWATREANARARLLFFEASRHHGWHCDRITSCLPTSPQLRAGETVVAPTDGWQRAVGQLRAIEQPERTVLRLLVLTRVIDPWLALEIGALVELANPSSDRVANRWFRFIGIDHEDDHMAMADLADELQAEMISLADRTALTSFDLA